MKTTIVLSILAAGLALTSCSIDTKSEDAAKEQAGKQKKVKKTLFIGDSITDGRRGENQHDLNHIYGHGFMMLCAADLQSRHPERDLQFFNRGISGNTLYDMEARWRTDAVDADADLVSILVGTNDVEYAIWDKEQKPLDFGDWERTYRAMLDTLRLARPDVEFVLCTPFVAKVAWRGEAANFPLRQSMVDSLDVIVGRIAADYEAILIRYDEMFRSLNQSAPRPDYWIWDGVHPTAAGHRRMADLWLEKTLSLFE